MKGETMNRIFHGDCLEVMQSISDKSIDMILCDLPYGTTACKWDTIIPFEPLWEQYKRIIKERGAIVLTASQPFTSALVMSNIKWFKYCWYWIKTRPTGFLNAKIMPLKNIENVCVFCKSKTFYYPQGLQAYNRWRVNSESVQKINVSKGPIAVASGSLTDKSFLQEFTNYPTQVLQIKSEGKTIHPTQKPVVLFEYLIKTYTQEGETVLDNCAGSGTTAIACMNTGRNYILIEKEKEYFDIMRERIKNHV